MNPAPAQAPTPSAATISAIKSQCPRHWRSLTQLLPVSPYWRLVPATDMRVLITGGSGYLGQFLIQCLSVQHDVAFTYLQNAVSPQQTAAQAFKVNLATGEGLQAAVSEFKPHVVINCAAISQPAACERDYEACKALNVPEHLITALQQLLTQHEQEALLIHISTDQVRRERTVWLYTRECVGAQLPPELSLFPGMGSQLEQMVRYQRAIKSSNWNRLCQNGLQPVMISSKSV